MIDRTEIRVVREADGWHVIGLSGTRVFRTRAAALGAAREEAWELIPSKLLIYNQKGVLRDVYRYDESFKKRRRAGN